MRRGRVAVAAACAVAACGRLGFDDHGQPRDAARSTDAPIVHDAPSIDTPLAIDATPIAPAFVQHGAASADSATVVTAQFPGAVTAGNTIVIGIDYGINGGAMPVETSILDDVGTSYNVSGPFDGRPGDDTRCYIAYGRATAGGPDAVTVTISGPSTNFFEVRLHEYTDISPTNPFDTSVGSDGSAVGSDSAVIPITTSDANELIFAMVIDGTVASGTGFTGVGSDFGDVTEDRVAPTPGTYDALATPDSAWVGFVAAFRGR